MRDLEADLKLCEAATPGPWYVVNIDDDAFMNAFAVCTSKDIDDFRADFGDEDKVIAITLLQSPLFAAVRDKRWLENATFIAAAREGWPEAIKRAMEAERRLQQLWGAADDLLCSLRASQITAAAIKQEPAVLEACRKLLDVLYNDPSGKDGGWEEAVQRALAAEARVAELEARLARLERVAEVAKRIADDNPFSCDPMDRSYYCRYCGRWEHSAHAENCLWVELRNILNVAEDLSK